MKVTGSYWFTLWDGGLVGIVVGVDGVTGEHKAYIGSLPFTSTFEDLDTKAIAEHGAELSLQVLLRIAAKLAKPREKRGKVKKPTQERGETNDRL